MIPCSYNPSVSEVEARRVLGALYPASIAYLMSSRSVCDPVSKNKIGLERWLGDQEH